ncbi:MAG: hypothetical protein ACYC3I_25935 [Gemmataceae bacterium]
MTTAWPFTGSLLAGPLCSTALWPCTLHARCCDPRPRFLLKSPPSPPHAGGGRGEGCRAVARNGRVLLCADRPMEELAGRLVRIRLQTWHRIYLPGDAPQPHGVLLCVRCVEDVVPSFAMELRSIAEARGQLRIDVGGGIMLDFEM